MVSVIPEEREQGTISTKTYYQYFRAGGHLVLLIAVVAGLVLGEVFSNMVTYAHTYTGHELL